MHRLRALNRKSDTAEFFYYVMEMATRNEVFIAGGNQTTIDHLTAEQLRRYRFAFPSIDEQRAIVASLESMLGKVELLVREILKSVERLAEYRAALITAAVTGKLVVPAPA